MTIAEFQGEYRPFSNFWYPKQKVTLDDNIWYPTTEHAYQAAKTTDLEMRKHIRDLRTPAEAKKFARTIELRSGWDDIKRQIMLHVVRQKFTSIYNNDLSRLLLSTGVEELVEGNMWHDNYWGACYCYKCQNQQGSNWLGKILMHVRFELSL